MMIVPIAAGGGVDIIARIVAERMREPLGRLVVVENIPAAAGTVRSAASHARRRTATRSRWAIRPASHQQRHQLTTTC